MMWKKYMNFRFQSSQMNFSGCTTTLIHLLLFTAALFCKGRGPSCSCDRHSRAHRLKYLLSGPFERSFANPCSPHLHSFRLLNTPCTFLPSCPCLCHTIHCSLHYLCMSKYCPCFKTQLTYLTSM